MAEIVDTMGSPPKRGRNLTLYDSYVALGSVITRVWLPSEVQLYSPVQNLTNKVLHRHGHFILIPTAGENKNCIELKIYYFTIMDNLNPTNSDPIDFCTSVTIYSHIHQHINSAPGVPD